ncbi:MAG: glycoside hydrolase family 43 protein [Clostridia bacterium]|nr:glycoside hydrolase family 43 protein [Clostridia bacterium]
MENKTIAVNPILNGFYPDPSICRVGEFYYLVNSSFVYFPGIPIFKSRDLSHWTQIGHVLDRNSQVPLTCTSHSEGIYAPTIRYNNGTFYIITTNVSVKRDVGSNRITSGNFIVTAKDPAGPWSEPFYLGEDAPGIDPSLFFDDDGRCYYIGTRPNPSGVRYNGDWEIWIQELDLATMKLTGESKAVWKGAMRDVIWPEGPHLYKKDGYYYVMHAEGGTGPEHCVAIARSKDLWGTYEGNPCNPILTHRHLGKEYMPRYVGHGDLVETPNGDWYMVMLGSRAYEGYTALGRETFLANVIWENDWPVVNPGEGRLSETLEVKLSPCHEMPLNKSYQFHQEPLPYEFVMLRNPDEKLYDIDAKAGTLTLPLKPETLEDLATPAYIGVRQYGYDYSVDTAFSFTPVNEKEAAGLAILQSNQYHLCIECVKKGDTWICQVLHVKAESNIGSITGDAVTKPLCRETVASKELGKVSDTNQLFLKLICHGQHVCIYAAAGTADYVLVGENIAICDLSTEVAGGFVGNTIGMYATSKGERTDNCAVFKHFQYQDLTP